MSLSHSSVIDQEKKTTEDELLKANRALKALTKCNEALIKADEESELLADICHIIVDIGGYRMAWIGYANHDPGKSIRPVAQVGFDKGYLEHARIGWGDDEHGSGPTGTTIKIGKPYVTRNILTEPKMAPWRDDAIRRGYASTLNLPLMIEKGVFGNLTIYSSRPDAFDPGELGLLSELSNNLAYGIMSLRERAKRKKVEDELREARDKLEVRVRERTSELYTANRSLRALTKCNEALVRAKDELTLLNNICNIIVDVGGYRMAWIGYADHDDERTVRPVAQKGYEDGYLEDVKISWADNAMGYGPTGMAIRTKKPYVSRNILTDDHFKLWRDEAVKRNYASTLALPLASEEVVLGTLNMYSMRPDVFDEDEIALLNDLAKNLAYGITTLRDRIKREDAEAALHEAKEQAELYLDLMGHDINNLNQIALGYLELAYELVEDGEIKELVSKPLDAILNSSKLIENVRTLQMVKMGGLKTEAIDLNIVLSELQAQYSNVPDKDVAIHFTSKSGCFVVTSGLVRDIFSNLIGNSIKHSRDMSSIQIDIELKLIYKNGIDYYAVTIADNGPGIADDIKTRIFTRFARGNTKAQGKGLGLYLVKTLIDDYHGDVWVEDRVCGDHTKGSKFIVILPAIVK